MGEERVLGGRRTAPAAERPVDRRTEPPEGRAPPERRTCPPEGALRAPGLADGRGRLDGAARGDEDRGVGVLRTDGEDPGARADGAARTPADGAAREERALGAAAPADGEGLRPSFVPAAAGRPEGARTAEGAERAAEPFPTFPAEIRSEGRRTAGAGSPRPAEGRAEEGRPAPDETVPRRDRASDGLRAAEGPAAGDALRDGARLADGVTAVPLAVPRREGARGDSPAVPRREGAAATRVGTLCPSATEGRDAGCATAGRERAAGAPDAHVLRAGSL